MQLIVKCDNIMIDDMDCKDCDLFRKIIVVSISSILCSLLNLKLSKHGLV